MPRDYTSSRHLALLEQSDVIHVPYSVADKEQTAFYITPDLPLESLWILFGGINSLALDWYQWFHRENSSIGLLLIDYPGYGLNDGLPRSRYMAEAGNRALTSLTAVLGHKEDWSSCRLGVLGHSLGSGAATLFAREHSVNKIILVSPYTSLHDLILYRYGAFTGFFINLINPERYPNAENLAGIVQQQPPPAIDIVHGKLDNVIPASMGRTLAKKYPQHVRYYELEELGHQNMFAHQNDLIFSLMEISKEE